MKIVVFTLGCKVNSCESASLINGLESMGHTVSEELSFADLYIINTCAVTSEAEKKSRQAIARAKKFNNNARIIVTGCASQNSYSSFENKQGVTLITGTANKSKILKMLDVSGVHIDNHTLDYDDIGIPKLTKTRAFIKVQDGCNNFCSYCLIPYLRGRSRSRNLDSIKEEILALNSYETVLTAINLSAYDYNGKRLTDLINSLNNVNSRIRLGSLEVNVIDKNFLQSLLNLKDFAPHFHLSLQSGSDNTLKNMNRKYSTLEYASAVNLIREYFPNAGITTDIIVGFPTETEKDFIDSYNFVKQIEFSDIHCFPFSPREGTKAYSLKDLPSQVKKERLNKLLALKEELKLKFITKNLGNELFLITEDYANGYTVGYTENYIKVYIQGEIKEGKYKVKLQKIFNDGALGVLI